MFEKKVLLGGVGRRLVLWQWDPLRGCHPADWDRRAVLSGGAGGGTDGTQGLGSHHLLTNLCQRRGET